MIVLLAACAQPVTSPAAANTCDAAVDRFTLDETVPFPAMDDPAVVWGSNSTGVAPIVAEDFDADGDVDFLQGRILGEPMLFLNDGSGQFSDGVDLPVLTAPEGFRGPAVFVLAAVDLDHDALPEVLAVGAGFVSLYRNLGGAFAEPTFIHTDAVGAEVVRTSIAIGDFDLDGGLDLILPGLTPADVEPGQDGEPTPLYTYFQREGAFVPGPPIADTMSLVTVAGDVDADRDPDLLVFSDRLFPTEVFRNDGAGGFTPAAAELALDFTGAAMGMDAADLDGNGRIDWCITDTTPPRCFLDDGAGRFYEAQLGLIPEVPAEGIYDTVGWSFDLVDLDNDGALDALQASGPHSPELGSGEAPAYSDLYWRGDGDGGFTDASAEAGLDDPWPNYSLVTADFDGDGAWEIVVAGPGAPPKLYRNRCTPGGWLDVDVVDGVGATVEVEAGGRTHVRQRIVLRGPGQGPARLHFGLGEAEVEAVRVHWPGGEVTELPGMEGGRVVTVGRSPNL